MSKVYGRRATAVRALRDVTLSIERGTFTAIMGPSGSGKSTLLHCLAALDSPTAGRVYLGRTELTALSRRQQAQVRRDRIGFVFQAFNLVPTLDALENITLPQRLAGRRPDRQWLEHVISAVGLGDRLRHRPGELSGGQQQRVALARALAGRPEVIFADEPTGNLDTTASGEMLTLLRDAVDQFDRTVITVTHDPTIARYADRVLFFTDGRVVDHADRPDVDQVLERVQATNGPNGHHVRPRQDGHDTMRSRRRRQSDPSTPGRPMVGSDDEVEVARQERWLQRIREQFESEEAVEEQHDVAWSTEPSSQHDGAWSTEPSLQHDEGGFAPHPPAPAVDTGVQQPHGLGDVAHDPGGSWAPDHADGGWLPTERSWVDADGSGAASVPGPYQGSHDEQTATPEPTPWSRPDDHSEYGDPAGQQPATAWGTDGDPWAPPDRDLAEEYRHGAGTTYPPRGRQADEHGHDRWSTSATWGQDDEHRDTADDRPLGSPNGHAAAGTHDERTPGDTGHARRFEQWRPPAEDVAPNGWTGDNGWHPDTPGTRNGDHGAVHDHRDAEPDHRDAEPDPPHVWTPRTPEPAADGHATESDPWSDVWDTTGGTDAADTWSPPSSNGQRAYDTGWLASPEPDPVHDTHERHDAGGVDDAVAGTAHPVADAAPDVAPSGDPQGRDDTSPTDEPTAHTATPPAAEPTADDTSPAAGVHERADSRPDDEPTTHAETPPTAEPTPHPDPSPAAGVHERAGSRPDDEPAAVPSSPSSSGDDPAPPRVNPAPRLADPEPPAPLTPSRPRPGGGTADATPNGRRAGASRSEPLIPPALASLRNLRRPDEADDTADTLQSLQAQLARLSSAPGRRNGSGQPRGNRPDDAKRPQRH